VRRIRLLKTFLKVIGYRPGGHPERAHLLNDFLKPDFPEARLLSFAHNSDWLIDAPVKTAQLIGDKLLEQLRDFRSGRSVRITKLLKRCC
jgi:hypothetical protein